jgi:4-hydroxyphenylpyruvate dioxygenase
MGPFPHDAPAPRIDAANPMGTDGFEFVEFAHPRPQELHELFRSLGFSAVATHRSKAVTLYRQGDVNYLVNEEPGSYGANFVEAHGPCAPAMAFRVVDARAAYERAIALGAIPADTSRGGLTLDVPAIEGIGGSLLYFVDVYGSKGSVYEAEFAWTGERDPRPEGHGLFYLDHLTHNVHRGRMDVWAGFYERLFNFRQIRYFDIEGKLTGLFSKALTSPDGKIRIPINESADEKSQIEEYLHAYNGEGIQHIACGCRDIYATIETLRAKGVSFMPPPPFRLLPAGRQACTGTWRAAGAARAERHSDRRGGRGGRRLHQDPAPALLNERDRTDLLRVHPAQGGRRLRRGELQSPVRVDRGGPDPPGRAERGRGGLTSPRRVGSRDQRPMTDACVFLAVKP